MSGIPWRGDVWSNLANIAAARGLTKAATRLQATSVPRAPKLTGMMRGSAQVTPASPDDLTAVVSYNTPYTVRQHEELGYRHTDGEAKFLENPLREEADVLNAIIAAEMRGVQ
jgi:hypothetical protein